MKWIALIAALALVHPIGLWARTRPRARVVLAVLLAFLPFYAVDINVVSFEHYRGDTRGLELSLADFVAYVLWVALPAGRLSLPLRFGRYAYLGAAVLSIALASVPLFAGFAVFKLLRTYFLFAVVYRACRLDGLAPHFVRGLALGVVYGAALGLYQRYGLGLMQTPGPFAHQNGFAMAANMIFPAALALALAGQGGRLAVITVGAAALTVVMSLSRGGMVLFAVAAAVVYVGSVLRRGSVRKAAYFALGALAAGALLLRSWDTISERFIEASDSSAEARDEFEEAARQMLHDHPLGIGMNQYSHVLGTQGYGERLGMDPNDTTGIVHNIYWLTAAELGWLGLAAFLLVLGKPLVAAAVSAVRDPSVRGDVQLGIAAALVVTYLQGKLEWALRMTAISQVLWILFALALALSAKAPRPGRRLRAAA